MVTSLLETEVPHVADHADDLHFPRNLFAVVQTHAAADRTAAREVPPREHRVNDRHRRRVVAIGGGEAAPLAQRNAEHAEVVGADHPVVRFGRIFGNHAVHEECGRREITVHGHDVGGRARCELPRSPRGGAAPGCRSSRSRPARCTARVAATAGRSAPAPDGSLDRRPAPAGSYAPAALPSSAISSRARPPRTPGRCAHDARRGSTHVRHPGARREDLPAKLAPPARVR